MRSLTNFKFVNYIALVALALCFSAGLGKAQDAYRGTFTLPFEAHWNNVVLPAGKYTIRIPSATTPYLVYLSGQGKTVIILANGATTQAMVDHSQLTLVSDMDKYIVRMLEAGQVGLTLDYGRPEVKAKSMAHAGAPTQGASKTSSGS